MHTQSRVGGGRSLLIGMIALTALCAWNRQATAGTLLGGSWTNPALYDVSESTGAATNPRTLSPAPDNLAGLAYSSTGQLYGLAFANASITSSELLSINPATGANTVIGSTGLLNEYEGDIAFDPANGVLYGIQNVPSSYQFFQLNTSTGAATNLTDLTGATFNDLSGLAFSSNGTMYILDNANSDTVAATIHVVDPSTGVVSSTLTLSGGIGVIAGMIFDPSSGTLYMADGTSSDQGTDSLYTVNLTTGSLTLIGTTVTGGLSALTIAPTTVPEPASAGAMALLMCAAGARRRSRPVAR